MRNTLAVIYIFENFNTMFACVYIADPSHQHCGPIGHAELLCAFDCLYMRDALVLWQNYFTAAKTNTKSNTPFFYCGQTRGK